MVIASTLVTVVIIVAIVAVVGAVFLAFGPLSRHENLRDDIEADSLLGRKLTDATDEELREDEGLINVDDEARLDRENE